jgi:hypothetical protein
VADALFDEALAEAAGALGAALGVRRLDPATEAAARDVLAGVAERADRRRMQAGLGSLGFDGREGLAQRVFDELFGLGATIQPLADDPTHGRHRHHRPGRRPRKPYRGVVEL